MFGKFYKKDLFAKIFGLGLFFLVMGAAQNFLYYSAARTGPLDLITRSLEAIPFSVIGLVFCLTSLPFLLVEWLTVPLGMHAKRIKLYQGAGNFFAFLMLVGGWVFNRGSATDTAEVASLTFSSGGLIVAVLFGWLGSRLAAFVSEKRIKIEPFSDPAAKPMPAAKQAAAAKKISVNEILNNAVDIPAAQH